MKEKEGGMTMRRRTACMLLLSVVAAGAASVPVYAGVVDDVTGFLGDVAGDAGAFLDDIGVGPVLRNGYNAASDFLFSYETQPDDADMESLARSWAVTAWLADQDKQDSNVYYFDNHTLTMVDDPAKIGGGYNLSKSPEGSTLTSRHSGILKAVVADASNYTVSWSNYEDEINFYLLEKMRQKNAPETEAVAEDSAAVSDGAGAPVQSEADVSAQNAAEAAGQDAAGAGVQGTADAAAQVGTDASVQAGTDASAQAGTDASAQSGTDTAAAPAAGSSPVHVVTIGAPAADTQESG